jgi:hypothetical protein
MNTEADFQEEFEVNRMVLEGMISEFSEWISSKLETEEVITVLGL